MSNKEFKLMSKKQWRGLANSCLDFIVDSIGIDNTLIMLFKNGVSKENLIELHFSLYDIEKAHNFYENWINAAGQSWFGAGAYIALFHKIGTRLPHQGGVQDKKFIRMTSLNILFH